MNIIKTLCPALLLVLSASSTKAEDLPSPRMMTISKGIICDTQEQVERLLTGISLNNGEFPEDAVEGCGKLRGILPAIVTPLSWYETPLATSLVARFVAPNGWTQFGWTEYHPNPDFQSVDTDPET